MVDASIYTLHSWQLFSYSPPCVFIDSLCTYQNFSIETSVQAHQSNDLCVFLQGDILFLHMNKEPIRAGEIVVFNVDVCPLNITLFTFYVPFCVFITFKCFRITGYLICLRLKTLIMAFVWGFFCRIVCQFRFNWKNFMTEL